MDDYKFEFKVRRIVNECVNKENKIIYIENETIGEQGLEIINKIIQQNDIFTSVYLINIDDYGYYSVGPDSEEIVKIIKKTNTITWLDLERSHITNIDKFAEALKLNTSIINLNLSGTFPSGPWNTFSDMLKYNKSLKWINLSANGINDNYINILVKGLILSSIEDIDISFNHFGEDGALAIADLLKVNKTIQNINLNNNYYFDDDCATAIAEALKINITIQSIDLNENYFGDAGATAIAEALKINITIRYIDLRDNRFGDAGATAIAEALEVNSKINLKI